MAYVRTDDHTVQLSVSATSPYKEGILSDGFVYPGKLLVQLPTAGEYEEFDTPGGMNQRIFATENVYIGGSIDLRYGPQSRIFFRQLRKGDIFLAWLSPQLAVVTIGTWLTPDSDGALKPWEVADLDGSLVGISLDDIAPSAEAERITVEIY